MVWLFTWFFGVRAHFVKLLDGNWERKLFIGLFFWWCGFMYYELFLLVCYSVYSCQNFIKFIVYLLEKWKLYSLLITDQYLSRKFAISGSNWSWYILVAEYVLRFHFSVILQRCQFIHEMFWFQVRLIVKIVAVNFFLWM